jgi:hypothetical protein
MMNTSRMRTAKIHASDADVRDNAPRSRRARSHTMRSLVRFLLMLLLIMGTWIGHRLWLA